MLSVAACRRLPQPDDNCVRVYYQWMVFLVLARAEGNVDFPLHFLCSLPFAHYFCLSELSIAAIGTIGHSFRSVRTHTVAVMVHFYGPFSFALKIRVDCRLTKMAHTRRRKGEGMKDIVQRSRGQIECECVGFSSRKGQTDWMTRPHPFACSHLSTAVLRIETRRFIYFHLPFCVYFRMLFTLNWLFNWNYLLSCRGK